jgi:hypothetical protein
MMRVLQHNGRLAIIEFHKRETSIWPPIQHRLDKAELMYSMENIGLEVYKDFDLGANFYCTVYLKK